MRTLPSQYSTSHFAFRTPRSALSISLSSGLSLIECLAYIAVLGVLISVGGVTVAKAWDQSRALSRSTADIQRAVNVGERWRKDVRAAVGPIELATPPEGETLRIPTAAGRVTYQFAGDEIRRRAGDQAAWVAILARVKSSQMQSADRADITAWRWEIELQPAQKKKAPRLRPLFTFLAVPGKETRK